MSDHSQTPPGNRPPAGRVFRPFTGGAATGQGSLRPSTPPSRPMRRPGQPFRPFFVGAHSQVRPREPQPAPTPVTVATTVAEPVASTPVPPTVHAEAAPIAHEAWEQYFAPQAEQQAVPEERQPEPAASAHSSEITVEVPQIDDVPIEREAEPATPAAPPRATSSPPVTVEVPAIPSEEAMAAIRDVATEGDLWEAAYTPAAPINEPSTDVVIDEVEAAFESAPPSAGDNTRADDVLVAAATLEAIARRLRNGEVDLLPAPGANMSREESALATVLAALLANR